MGFLIAVVVSFRASMRLVEYTNRLRKLTQRSPTSPSSETPLLLAPNVSAWKCCSSQGSLVNEVYVLERLCFFRLLFDGNTTTGGAKGLRLCEVCRQPGFSDEGDV